MSKPLSGIEAQARVRARQIATTTIGLIIPLRTETLLIDKITDALVEAYLDGRASIHE